MSDRLGRKRVLLFGILLLTIPASPRWLAQQGRLREAREVIEGINGPERSAPVLQEIQESISEETGAYSELLRPGIRTAFLVAVLLGLFNLVWTAVYSGTHAFPILIEFSEGLMGSAAGVFWIFILPCACAFLFGLKLLPGTKGQTLEQIAHRWDRRLRNWQSVPGVL